MDSTKDLDGGGNRNGRVDEHPSAITRDNLLAGFPVGVTGWTAYTPTWSAAGTAVSLGDGTVAGAYAQVGKTVHFWFKFVAGSTSTFGTGLYRWALPVTADTAQVARTGIGTAQINDTGTADYAAILRIESTTLCSALETSAANQYVGQLIPMTWANGDGIYASGTYEAA